jgi:hypothetical protein
MRLVEQECIDEPDLHEDFGRQERWTQPSDDSLSTPENIRRLALAYKLLTLNARLPVISALTGLPRRVVVRLHWEVHDSAPVNGLLPYDANWITKTATNCIHASLFMRPYLIIHDRINSREQVLLGQVFLKAFELYLDSLRSNVNPTWRETTEPQLSIDRAYTISRQYHVGQVMFKPCETCHSGFVAVREVPVEYQLCPVCGIWPDPTRWNIGKARAGRLAGNKGSPPLK